MKLSSLNVIALLLGLGFGGIASASSIPRTEEVPIRRVFFPTIGYDDNDNVQMVIEGPLPDVCYVVGEHRFKVDTALHRITIHQSAWRRMDGPCGNGDMLPESSFSEDISIGRLEAGDYLVNYRDDRGTVLAKKLHVGRANLATIDDVNYARVNTLDVKPLNLSIAPVTFKIRGLLSNTCNMVKEPIDVKVIGDAIVVRPVEVPAPTCEPVPGDMGFGRVYEKTIDLGFLNVGEYLAHIRSQGGRAVEQTFEVVPPLR